MACINSKSNVTHISLKKELLVLFTFTSWILLLLGNNHSFEFVHCLATPKNGHSTTGRSSSFPSPRNLKSNAISRSRQEESIVNMQEKERTIVILYNKPPNIITSHESQDSRETVYEDIQSMMGFSPPSQSSDLDTSRNWRRNCLEENKFAASAAFEEATGIRSKLHAIGRLDADTTGLLLLTNDGRLVHHVTNPDAKIQDHEYYSNSSGGMQSTTNIINKTYQALIMGHHTEKSLRPIRHGVDIGKNYVTKPLLHPDDLQVLEHPNHKSTIISITIGEGKNRQVRKMFHAIGSGVMKLKRTRIGEHLTLEGLKEGEWRLLTDDEVQRYLSWIPRDIVASSPTGPRPRQKKRRGSSHKSKQRRRSK